MDNRFKEYNLKNIEPLDSFFELLLNNQLDEFKELIPKLMYQLLHRQYLYQLVHKEHYNMSYQNCVVNLMNCLFQLSGDMSPLVPPKLSPPPCNTIIMEVFLHMKIMSLLVDISKLSIRQENTCFI